MIQIGSLFHVRISPARERRRRAKDLCLIPPILLCLLTWPFRQQALLPPNRWDFSFDDAAGDQDSRDGGSAPVSWSNEEDETQGRPQAADVAFPDRENGREVTLPIPFPARKLES